MQSKFSWHALFFRASASCSKVLNDKKYTLNTVKNFRATLFLRASASYSKILNIKSTFNTCSENFQDNSLFQGKRKFLKNS